MVARIAQAETDLADAASQAGVADGVSAVATSLAEAIEADRATAAAAEARQTVVARTEIVAAAFARVSRAIRLTVMLAERLDRGWAGPGGADDRDSTVRRQKAGSVADGTGREREGERAAEPTETRADRLETLDKGLRIGNRSNDEILGFICRQLGLDPVRMTVSSPLLGTIRFAAARRPTPPTEGGTGWRAPPPQRRPDG